jgi:phospholipid/cholesterol/gamma-HCH transport system substrate-binding protein
VTTPKTGRRLAALACCVAVVASGCAFDGLNSLPLPGTVGTGSDAVTYHVQIANVGTLESNSPVMLNDVVVGAVRRMKVDDWRADVEVSVQPDVVVPANAVATVGQTSLLGSMHLALDPPVGEEPSGRLPAGATIPMSRTSTYPSTEQTLSSLSVVVNGGGLAHVGDIVRNFNAALDGRQVQVRDLITRMNRVVTMLDDQHENIIASIDAINRMAEEFADQRPVLTAALERIPPALEVLNTQRPRLTTALQRLGEFSDTATQLLNESQDDIVRNLRNLEPTVRALADVGPDLMTALSYLPTYPYTQDFIDRGIRGDYMNQFIVFDFTIPRLKSGILLGTRWGDPNASMVPAPGDPWYNMYTRDPLQAPITPPTDIAPLPPLGEPPAEGGN